MNLKSTITTINSWNDFKFVLEHKTNLEKGKAFEELTKYFLAYNPVYKSKLKSVWLQREVPASVIKKLNLPFNDQGIDLIAETFEGDFWAIQCKYLQDENQKLSHRKISTFLSLSKGIAENISYCLVCTTVDDYADLYRGKKNIGFCNSDVWNKLDKPFFDWLRVKIAGKEKNIVAFKPKPHQEKAILQANKYFLNNNNKRGKLVFPCGAGKSLTGYLLSVELKAQSVIVAVPSLSLVKQTLEVYLRESVANKDKIEWLCVCSDEGIGKNDDIAIHTQDIGVPCVTDKETIIDWLKKHRNNKAVVFTTYQSGKTISEATKTAQYKFDLGILDEAHKTVGDKDKIFSHLLFDKNISIAKRIFMTATERRYSGSSDTILSMDDAEVYGETFATLSFKEAIADGILSDYKIITLFISDEEVKQLIQKNAFVKPKGKEWDKETEARTLASLIALRKAMDENPIHHAVSFHSSIAKSKSFEESQPVFSSAYPKFSKVDAFHVSGAMPTAVRSKIVDEFANSEKSIITNAKCLTEGVDVPDIDCVLFADPRKSTIDIVQAVGRALRKKEGKKYGYVLLPVFTKSKNKESIIESAEFNEVLTTLRALASNDERIIEYFRDISKGKKVNRNDSPVSFEIDEKISELINADDFINSLQLTAWNKLAKLSWRYFEEAREYVRKENINSHREWNVYCLEGRKPFDIPIAPDQAYKRDWVSWGDFLGTNSIAHQLKIYRSFEDAKSFVRKLGLKSSTEWKEYCRSTLKPLDIPAKPDNTYKNKWISWGDFWGSGVVAPYLKEFKSFEETKSFARKLGLRSFSEWRSFCKSGKKPDNIPFNPDQTYKSNGWKSWGDFLGTGRIADQKKVYLSYEDAKSYVIKLFLKSVRDWKIYCKSDKKPHNIPSHPPNTYIEKWQGWGDFLGTGMVAPRLRKYKSFEEARDFVRNLGLKSKTEWMLYCKSGEKPDDIPTNGNSTYKTEWKGWGDYLGTGRIASHLKLYRSYTEAKNFARKHKLSSNKKWKLLCLTGVVPDDIPFNPDQTYKYKGWKGWADFLGKA